MLPEGFPFHQFIFLNIRGLCYQNKRNLCFKWLKQNEFEIILLHEVHCNNITKCKWKDEWGGPCVFSGNSSQKEGEAIIIYSKSDIKIENEIELQIGRVLMLK